MVAYLLSPNRRHWYIAKVKNYNLNVTEVRDSDFKNAFPGIFNFTVGILCPIELWEWWIGEILFIWIQFLEKTLFKLFFFRLIMLSNLKKDFDGKITTFDFFGYDDFGLFDFLWTINYGRTLWRRANRFDITLMNSLWDNSPSPSLSKIVKTV